MVKVALQLSGRLRYTEKSANSLIAAIIEQHRPDIFCSFWEPENLYTLENWNEYFKPQCIEVENQALIRPYLDELFNFNVHANMPSMSYKFHRVSIMRQGYEIATGKKYDCVIQARTDNIFFERLQDQVNLPVSMQGIYCANGSTNPSIDSYISPRMVDNFYLGDPASMDVAGKTFWYLREQARDYTSKGMLHHVRIPEIIQSKVWNDLGIRIMPLPGSNPFGNFHYDIDRNDTPWR